MAVSEEMDASLVSEFIASCMLRFDLQGVVLVLSNDPDWLADVREETRRVLVGALDGKTDKTTEVHVGPHWLRIGFDYRYQAIFMAKNEEPERYAGHYGNIFIINHGELPHLTREVLSGCFMKNSFWLEVSDA